MKRTWLMAAVLALGACGPATKTVNLRRGETIQGVAGLTDLRNPADNRIHQTAIQISLFGTFAPGESFQLRVRHGTCAAPGSEAYRLDDLTIGQTSGPTETATVIDAPLENLTSSPYSIEVLEVATQQHPDAGLFGCGDIL